MVSCLTSACRKWHSSTPSPACSGTCPVPAVVLVIFVALPIFYGITSHGLYELTRPVQQLP